LAVINCLWLKGGIILPLTRSQKEKLVNELHESFEKSNAVIVVHYQGVNVADTTALRVKIREAGGDYRVAKNTLLKRAIKDTHAEVLSDVFSGPNAVAIAYDDPVALAKVLVEFAKDVDSFEVKSGVLNGNLMDVSAIEALSKLPSREVLVAKLLSVLVATPTNFVQVLSGVPRKLLYALKAIEEQKQ
jgi:large subunit ribosomal protein L10